jgi:quercetin dioxygenase-like cupin family protein
MTNSAGIITPAGQGQTANVMGIPLRFLALGADTAGVIDALEAEFPAGSTFAAHIHRNSDEGFYVLQGELTMQLGDRRVKVSPGTFGFAPRGLVHGFEN